MSEVQLFTVSNKKVKEIPSTMFRNERELQNLFENNLEELLGVRFIASEYSTSNGGRIDTLGIDENGFPVIIEYKLDKNRTVINQGMFYMAWLRSHPAEFWKAVFEKFGKEVADSIDSNSIRLICLASDFSREDLGAYELMPNNIDLLRYRRFGENHLLIERITTSDSSEGSSNNESKPKVSRDKPFAQWLEEAPPSIKDVYEILRQTILGLGDDISEKQTKRYVAFKRIRNFATVTSGRAVLNLYLRVNPKQIELGDGLRDVSNIGHWGTGDLEVEIKTQEDIKKHLPFIQRAYEGQT